MTKYLEELSSLYSPSSLEAKNADRPPHQAGPSLRRTGRLIKDRLGLLVEELDDMIDDCSMRVDGMTIATQWSQGDTTVDIATAAGRHSSQMRSIALVTMIFLPGTFFATVFSMTFFNWGSQDGAIVSSYIWIYFLVTVLFTAVTLA
ncbi:hypothetical protein C8A00DRAFT_33833, partial [Chaetomidium leptoderma]